MKQLKKISAYIIITLLSGNLIAQEIHVYGGGGLSTLNYKLTIGEQTNGFGGLVGAKYTYMLTNNLGIGAGVELSLYSAKAKLDGFTMEQNTTDYMGTDFKFKSKLNNYEEKQSATFVNIPIMLQYSLGMFYVSAGAKIGIPLTAKHTPSGKLNNSGYYLDENYEYVEQDFLGLGAFRINENKKKLNLNMAYMASAEVGVIWDFESTALFTGVYFDYGLNNILKDKPEKHLIEYNEAKPEKIKVNSILNSQYESKAITEKLAPMAIGIKISFVFNRGEKTKSVKQRVYR